MSFAPLPCVGGSARKNEANIDSLQKRKEDLSALDATIAKLKDEVGLSDGQLPLNTEHRGQTDRLASLRATTKKRRRHPTRHLSSSSLGDLRPTDPSDNTSQAGEALTASQPSNQSVDRPTNHSADEMQVLTASSGGDNR